MSVSNFVRWLPLESNPDVINKYVNNIGVSTEKFEFIDIYGLDPELLQMVPKPVIAVLFLFPITKKYEDHRKLQKEKHKEIKQKLSPHLFFTKQTVQNACGTVGIIHSLANNKSHFNIDSDLPFGKFLKATEKMTPEESAEYLKQDDGIANAHQDASNEGQTETPDINEDVELHFIAFVHKDGELYELDGANDFPINHGKSSEETLLEDACEVIKKLIAVNPDEVRFNLIGLAPKEL